MIDPYERDGRHKPLPSKTTGGPAAAFERRPAGESAWLLEGAQLAGGYRMSALRDRHAPSKRHRAAMGGRRQAKRSPAEKTSLAAGLRQPGNVSNSEPGKEGTL
jgi:hypothetical protein